MWRSLPALLLLLPLSVPAAESTIYRTIDEDGNVVFTDKPPSEDADPVELDPVTTVPAYEGNRATNGGDTGSGASSTAPSYGGLSIRYPTADEAIRHNGGQIPFQLELRPQGIELAESHQVEIVVDGEVKGRGRPPTVTAGPVDRGPHEAFARVVDAGRNTLVRSPAVNFFLLRASIPTP